MRAFPVALLAVAACAGVVVWLRSGRAEVRGVLVDASGVPVPGARVGYEGEAAGVRTDSRGAFAVEARELGGRLVVLDAGYATVRPSAAAPGDTSRAHVIVAAPAVEMRGRMVDARGEGVAGTLRLDLDGSGEYAQPLGADALAGPVAWAFAASDGRFAARWPFLPRARVVAAAPGFGEELVGPLDEVTLPLEIAMSCRRLFGFVRDADGTAVVGATVQLGNHWAWTDEDGLFEVHDPTPQSIPRHAALVVSAEGHLPVEHEDFGATLDFEDLPCSGFELVLGEPEPPEPPEPTPVPVCELAVHLERSSPFRRYEVRLAHPSSPVQDDSTWGPIDEMPDTWAADRDPEGPTPTRVIRAGRRVFLGYRAGRFLGPAGAWDVVLFDVWDRREVGRTPVVLTPEHRTTVSF